MDDKDEIFRMLDPRWHWYRAVLLREKKRTWVEIAVSMDRHESTVKEYAKRGARETEHAGTLHFYLSKRARRCLVTAGLDPTLIGAEVKIESWMRIYGRNARQSEFGIGPVTRNEILNAIDTLYDSQLYCRQLAGER